MLSSELRINLTMVDCSFSGQFLHRLEQLVDFVGTIERGCLNVIATQFDNRFSTAGIADAIFLETTALQPTLAR